MRRRCDVRADGLRSRRRGVCPGRCVALIVAVIALMAAGASTARADGDPASDELIASDVFYPDSSPVPQAAQTALNRAVATAHRDGVPLKVAIIARRGDLGSVTEVFAHPQRYAAFLDSEISLSTPQPLLVVMADGDGVEGLTPGERRAVLAASGSVGDSGAALAGRALSAVRRVDDDLATARADGAVDGRLPPVLLPALVLGVMLVVAMLIVVRAVFPERPGPAHAPHRQGGNA